MRSRIDSGRADSGSILLPAVIGLVALMGMGALAVDLGLVLTAKEQLQTAADAAALAGVKQLGFGRLDGALQEAATYAARNTTLGEPVVLDPGDMTLGLWSFDGRQLVADPVAPNALRIVARRLRERDHGVAMSFARTLGIPEIDVQAQAIAVAIRRAIVVVIDRSGDMGPDPGCGGNPVLPPIIPAREAAAVYFEEVARSTLPERGGLVSYALQARGDVPIVDLDLRLGYLVRTLNALEAEPCGELGATNTGAGIDLAVDLFERMDAQAGPEAMGQRIMIVLSNGLTNRGEHGEEYWPVRHVYHNPAWLWALRAAERADRRGITIHTIALGTAGQPSELRGLMELQMREIAQGVSGERGGLALVAPTPGELEDVFVHLSRLVQVALVD